MHRFRNLPIRHKLTLVIMLTSSAVLILAAGAAIAYEFARFRREIVNDLTTQAEITTISIAPAMFFDDAKAGAEVLAALQTRPEIISVRVYRENGDMFVDYRRAGAPSAPPLPPASKEKLFEMQHDQIRLCQPILFNEEPLGTLCMRADLAGQWTRLKNYVEFVALFFVALLCMSLLFSGLLQRAISDPIRSLARFAMTVAEKKDYSLRAPLRGEDEIGSLITSVNQMIEQIQQQDTAVRESEVRYRHLVESAPDAIGVTVGGQIVFVNEAGRKMVGARASADVLGRSILEFIEPADRPLAEERMRMLVNIGVPGPVTELRARRFDGTAYRVEVVGTLVSYQNQPAIQVIIRDVTERRRMEEALRESEERFRQLAGAIDEVFWMSNVAKTGMLYVSPGYEKIWGRSCASLYASPRQWIDAIHSEDRLRVLIAAETRQARGEYDEQYRIIRPDGAQRWIRDRAFPIRDAQGVVFRIAGIAEDITERKRLEREILEISDREQSRIGQDLHDGLCQELVSAAFAGSLLQRQLAEMPAPAAATAAGEVTDLINGAIGQARNMARVLYPVALAAEGLEVALRELVGNVSHLFAIGCRFECEQPVTIPDHLTALHLYRIAQEAVNNALKHGRATQIDIALRAADGKFTLTVMDNGIGYSTTAAQSGGMGHHIMEYRASMIGGTIEIDPGPAGGTRLRCSNEPRTPV